MQAGDIFSVRLIEGKTGLSGSELYAVQIFSTKPLDGREPCGKILRVTPTGCQYMSRFARQTLAPTYSKKGNNMPFDLKAITKALGDFSKFASNFTGLFKETPKFFELFGNFNAKTAENTKNAFQVKK